MSRAQRTDVVLFTTSDMAESRQGELLRLIASVERAVTHGLSVVHYLLVQRCPAGVVAGRFPPWMRIESIGRRVSLSHARNLLMRRALDEGVMDHALMVAFPDDDAWYPDGVLHRLTAYFRNRSDIDLLTCHYGSMPDGRAGGIQRLSIGGLVSIVSSNTLFLRAAHVAEIGGFDEMLGVGAALNGGEDLDYALRACIVSGKTPWWFDATLVGHRDRAPWTRARYFPGSLYAILRSARSHPGIAFQALRKLIVGVCLVCRREMHSQAFVRSVRDAVGALRTRPPQWR